MRFEKHQIPLRKFARIGENRRSVAVAASYNIKPTGAIAMKRSPVAYYLDGFLYILKYPKNIGAADRLTFTPMRYEIGSKAYYQDYITFSKI